VPNLTTIQRAALAAAASIGPKVDALVASFSQAGYELYLVGGSVRDALLDRPSVDLDYTTSARPDQIERLVRQMTDAVWDVGRAFGTIACRISEADGSDHLVEITTFRADAYDEASRKPIVQFGDHLGGDLVRRDFTVNAMALNMTDGELLDPFGGLADLDAMVLRTPAAPEISFSDDPLRMLRAARFASQLGLRPVPELIAAMKADAERIKIISAERVRDELTKLLLTDNPRPGLDLLVDTGLADFILPELSALRMERDEHNHHKDVYQHTLTVIEQAIQLERARGHQPDLINRLAALFHDIGKPRTRRFEPGGKVSFHHHDVVGAKMTRKRMQALHFSNEQIKTVSDLVELHLRFHGYGEGQWTDSAVRRYVRDAGEQLEHLHILTRADCTTRNQRKADRLRRSYEELEWRIDELGQREELAAIRPDLNGTQIMEILGISEGREVGAAYKYLLERRLEDGPTTKEQATEALRDWWRKQRSAQ